MIGQSPSSMYTASKGCAHMTWQEAASWLPSAPGIFLMWGAAFLICYPIAFSIIKASYVVNKVSGVSKDKSPSRLAVECAAGGAVMGPIIVMLVGTFTLPLLWPVFMMLGINELVLGILFLALLSSPLVITAMLARDHVGKRGKKD